MLFIEAKKRKRTEKAPTRVVAVLASEQPAEEAPS